MLLRGSLYNSSSFQASNQFFHDHQTYVLHNLQPIGIDKTHQVRWICKYIEVINHNFSMGAFHQVNKSNLVSSPLQQTLTESIFFQSHQGQFPFVSELSPSVLNEQFDHMIFVKFSTRNNQQLFMLSFITKRIASQAIFSYVMNLCWATLISSYEFSGDAWLTISLPVSDNPTPTKNIQNVFFPILSILIITPLIFMLRQQLIIINTDLMILLSIVTLLVLYALVAYIRRKTAKPNYTNKLVWITGASSGIGEYLAYEFNRLGAYVVLSARNAKELERVKASCTHPENAEVLPMDMANFKEVRRMTQQFIEGLEAKGKRIDLVVENAGLSMRCEFVNYSFENHVSLYDINVHGPYNHLQVVVPHMIKNKGGHIVGITSQAGKLSTAYRSSYGGSKHAFIGILDSIRSELKPFGIRVCNVMPGYIRTNLAKNAFAGAPGEKFGKTDLNIDTGMDPAQFSKEAVGAIYNNENEVSISKDWMPALGFVIRNLCPDLTFFMLHRNAKVQQHAVDNAKKE